MSELDRLAEIENRLEAIEKNIGSIFIWMEILSQSDLHGLVFASRSLAKPTDEQREIAERLADINKQIKGINKDFFKR